MPLHLLGSSSPASTYIIALPGSLAGRGQIGYARLRPASRVISCRSAADSNGRPFAVDGSREQVPSRSLQNGSIPSSDTQEQALRQVLEGIQGLSQADADTEQLYHDLEQQSRALQALHAELCQAKRQQSEESEAAHGRYLELEEALALAEQHLQELSQSDESAASGLEQLQAQLQEQTELTAQLQQQLTQAEELREAASSALEGREGAFAEQLGSTQQELDEITRHAAQQKSELVSLRDSQNERDNEVERLRAELQREAGAARSFRDRTQQLQQAVQELSAQEAASENELRAQCGAAESRARGLQEEVGTLHRELEHTSGKLAEANVQLAAATRQKDHFSSELAARQQKLREVEAAAMRTEQAERKFSHMASDNDHLQILFGEAQDQIVEQREAAEARGKEVTELQRNNLHLNSELQRFQSELQHAECHQGEAARKLGETEAKAEKLGQQLAETHMQLGEGSRQLWEAEEALQAAQGKLQEQSAEQQSLVQRHEGTQADLAEAGRKLQVTSQDLGSAQEELEEVRVQHKEATTQLRTAAEEARRVPGLSQRLEELQAQLQERETVLQALQGDMEAVLQGEEEREALVDSLTQQLTQQHLQLTAMEQEVVSAADVAQTVMRHMEGMEEALNLKEAELKRALTPAATAQSQAELRSSLQRESALQNEVQRLMSQQPEASSLSNGANGVRADSLQTQQLEAMAKRLELLAADKAAAEAAAAHAQQQLQALQGNAAGSSGVVPDSSTAASSHKSHGNDSSRLDEALVVQKLAELEEENQKLKAVGSARGRVLKQSRAVIDAYLARSAALSHQELPVSHEDAQELAEAVDDVIADSNADHTHHTHTAKLAPAMDGITTG